ncbi:hypothetical protein [Halosimplex amylolyticum]|uniref:hypothetical protein n=1 Tax=Halosimplex amylolyticum TaxID=3396616 RepID=UPI003F54B562
MNSTTEAVAYAVTGLLLVSFGAAAFSPLSEQTMVTEVVERGDVPESATVTNYSALPPGTRTAVDGAIEDGHVVSSSYEDEAAVEALRGNAFVRKDGTVYWLRTTSADGNGGLFEGNARDSVLAIGGLLVGVAAYVSGRGRRPLLLALPVAACLALLGANVLAAPDPSEVSWLGNTSFALAAAVPVLAGIAARLRDVWIAGAAAGTLALSVAVLLWGPNLSALYFLVPLVGLAVPGTGLGWLLGGRTAARS